MFLVGIFDELLGVYGKYHKLIDYFVLKPKKKNLISMEKLLFLFRSEMEEKLMMVNIKKRNSWPFSFHQKVWNKAFKNP